MADKLTQSQENTSAERNVAISGNALIEKVFAPLMVVSVSAVFYYTGWVYIAHWYSYYGIDATLINIPLQIILLHGFPGILALGISGLAAILGFAVYKRKSAISSLEIEDAPNIVIAAYLIYLAIILIISWIVISYSRLTIDIPKEVLISLLGLYLVTFIRQIRYGVKIIDRRNAQKRAKAFMELFLTQYPDGEKRLIELLRDVSANQEEINKMTQELEARSNQTFQLPSIAALNTIESMWRVWISIILLFYFLTSVSLSSLLGEWDAARGARFMIGNWHIPEISLYSTYGIPALTSYEDKNGNYFEYQPLGLLTSTDKVYYLVDVKGSTYYTKKPNVYIVPRSDSLTLNFVVSPYVPQKPAPIPAITNTPTLTPAATITPTQ